MKAVALVTLHGMGPERPDYHHALAQGLAARLGAVAWDRVALEPVHYARILQDPQDALWDAMTRDSANDLDASSLRRFFLYGLGDAGSLEHSAGGDRVQYLDVQRAIQAALHRAYLALGEDPDAPVVIVAHSLGGQVISSYLWDAGRGSYLFRDLRDVPRRERRFLRLKSLRHLVTTGCNIPLFVSGLAERVCFERPNDAFTWDNYYDPDDVLGWPLRQLGPSYGFVRDHAVNAGGPLTSWNPLSHNRYDTDADVLGPLARQLARLLGEA